MRVRVCLLTRDDLRAHREAGGWDLSGWATDDPLTAAPAPSRLPQDPCLAATWGRLGREATVEGYPPGGGLVVSSGGRVWRVAEACVMVPEAPEDPRSLGGRRFTGDGPCGGLLEATAWRIWPLAQFGMWRYRCGHVEGDAIDREAACAEVASILARRVDAAMDGA